MIKITKKVINKNDHRTELIEHRTAKMIKK
jgi:hypothetical protein